MSLFNYKCEECGKGIVRDTEKTNYKVKLFKEDFRVKKAIIGICDNCEAINFAGEEIERWKKKYKKWQAKSAKYLAPEKVKEIRDNLDMSQKDFGKFIGVSRQSISVWEQPDRPSVQPKNVDIVFRMLYEELDSDQKPVINKMLRQYNEENEHPIPIEKGKVDTKSEQLKKLLPKTTSKILDDKAKENNTTLYVEFVRSAEIIALKDSYSRVNWKTNKKLSGSIEDYEFNSQNKNVWPGNLKK